MASIAGSQRSMRESSIFVGAGAGGAAGAGSAAAAGAGGSEQAGASSAANNTAAVTEYFLMNPPR
jgi:hypothetical protein